MTIAQVMGLVEDLARGDNATSEWHDNTLCVTVQDIGEYNEDAVDNFLTVLDNYCEDRFSYLYNFRNFDVFVEFAADFYRD